MKITTRAEKLVALQTHMNLETGLLDESSFPLENALYAKSILKKSLDRRIRTCKLCPGLNIKTFTEAAVGYGDLNASIFFVGQSLHSPGVTSGIPFILGSGFCLDAALYLSGLTRKDVFISNVVHCHPEGNRASELSEKKNCEWYLWQEVFIVQPKLIVALGNDAHWAVGRLPSLHIANTKIIKIRHPASFAYGAPEERGSWIVKLSLALDKVL